MMSISLLNKENTYCYYGGIIMENKKTFEDLMQIIKEANARRKPDPDPIFPVKLPSFPGEQRVEFLAFL